MSADSTGTWICPHCNQTIDDKTLVCPHCGKSANERQTPSNAFAILENNLEKRIQTEKPSELLWGSVAEAIQALATSRDKQLSNHRSMHWFIGVLTKELNDQSIAEAFYLAENLHQKGFHEIELDIRDVSLVVDPIRKLVQKLLDLIPKEFINEL